MEESFSSNIVLDNGSHSIRVGFAGEDEPKVVFPTIAGDRKNKRTRLATGRVVGDEAASNRSTFNLRRPIERGIVKHWKDMEGIWRHVFFDQLEVDPTKHNVLISELPLSPKENREKGAEMMFETFQTSGVYFETSAMLAIYSSNKTKGVIVDCGEGVCSVVPFYEGYQLSHAIWRLEIGGQDLTDYLMRMLTERGRYFPFQGLSFRIKDQMHACDVKEALCYAALDYEAEMEAVATGSAVEKSFQLPDGELITIGNERFRCPEALFKPSLVGHGSAGLHEVLNNSISKCDIDIRKELFSDILLVGGSTMFPGIGDRLQKEVSVLSPPSMKVKISARPQRKSSVWIGGSVLASLSTFQNQWISKSDYEEIGASVLHKKLH